jgi:hypothetical protein
MEESKAIELQQRHDEIMVSAKSIEITDYISLVNAVCVRLRAQQWVKNRAADLDKIIKELNELKKKKIAERKELVGDAEALIDILDEKIGRDYFDRRDDVKRAEEEINQLADDNETNFLPTIILPPAERTIQTEIGSLNIRPDVVIEITDKMKIVKNVAKCNYELGYVEIDLSFVKKDYNIHHWSKMPGFKIKDKPVITGRPK